MSKSKIVSLISAPGGVGKTTIALCLSWFLKEQNRQSLLIDLDPSLGLTLTLKDYAKYKTELEDKKKTSADLLRLTIEGKTESDYDFGGLFADSNFEGIPLDFIASSLRLEEVMSTIWHTHAGHGEKKLKLALENIPSRLNYETIIIDNVPCYALNYALMTLFASDICIVPMRLTRNDLGRTISMMLKLQEYASIYEMTKETFFEKLRFVFNDVAHYKKEKKIRSYKTELLDGIPKAKIFNYVIDRQIGFTRINTKDSTSKDVNNVKEKFRPFFKEFNNLISQ